jgi:hypothetical protein
MKRFVSIGLFLTAAALAAAADDVFDRVEDSLTWSSADGEARARVSGLFDLEAYALPDPTPGLIDVDGSTLVNPRLSVFLDAQLGQNIYVFAQGRADRGFDPGDGRLRARLDEYAVRWSTPGEAFNLQAGKFATVFGSWAPRHGSWSDPFITAPLPYENLTGAWDSEAPHSSGQLLVWSHVRPGLPDSAANEEKYVRLPIIWGPSYATGAAVAGGVGKFRYAVEVKSAALASRPEVWAQDAGNWDYPTISSRVRYVPDERWEFGVSASSGSFIRSSAEPALFSPWHRGDYREIVFGQDASFAWHHLQLWAEVFEARFEIPTVGTASATAAYIEGKYKFTPEFSAALRVNGEWFGTIPDRGAQVRWGHDVARLDIAPCYRFGPHFQVKLQYSVQRGNPINDAWTEFLGVQSTVRF